MEAEVNVCVCVCVREREREVFSSGYEGCFPTANVCHLNVILNQES